MKTDVTRSALLSLAGVLAIASIFLPLWGMTLVSVQYPEGLRMVVHPTTVVGDIAEINVLNHYIGMAEISSDYFVELRVLPLLLGLAGLAALAAALVPRWWTAGAPLALLVGTAVYGLSSMRRRLWEYGHDLDPTAAIDVEPFTPAMLGEHVIAQFATYAFFSWGTLAAGLAGVLLTAVLWRDLRDRREGTPVPGRGAAPLSEPATSGDAG